MLIVLPIPEMLYS